MRITFVTRKFGNVERNSHCDVLHITPIRVANLVLDCNGDFAIKAYAYENINYRYSACEKSYLREVFFSLLIRCVLPPDVGCTNFDGFIPFCHQMSVMFTQ